MTFAPRELPPNIFALENYPRTIDSHEIPPRVTDPWTFASEHFFPEHFLPEQLLPDNFLPTPHEIPPGTSDNGLLLWKITPE